MYASIFGMFSFSWFGWAQENPRASWRKYLGIGSGIALLVCLFGVFLSIRNWDAPSALSASTSFRQYLISVYAEIFLAGAGAGWLILQKRKDFIAPWIAFIVGIHFISLAGVFEDPSLYLLAAAGGSVSCFSLFSRKLRVANSAITGIGAGTALFGFALSGLIRFALV